MNLQQRSENHSLWASHLLLQSKDLPLSYAPETHFYKHFFFNTAMFVFIHFHIIYGCFLANTELGS